MCLRLHSSQDQNQISDSELNKSKHTPCCLSGGGVETNPLLSSFLPKALKGQGPAALYGRSKMVLNAGSKLLREHISVIQRWIRTI